MKEQQFTDEQILAVSSDHPQILCVAGPGSGKTTVLSARIRRIIEDGGAPKKIVAITYTNAAARNLELRLAKTYDVDTIGPVLGFCGTLHGFALRMLKQHGAGAGYGDRTAVIDEEASRDLLESKAKALGCKVAVDKLVELKRKGKPDNETMSVAEITVAAYFDELHEAGIVDFDLILSEFYRLLSSNMGFSTAISAEFTHLFVDEVQDSASLDWMIFESLPLTHKFLVGDPDQAIYGFRGGRSDLMIRFSKEPATKIIWLEENFRCGSAICDAANALIAHNLQRLEKATVSATDLAGRVTPFGQTLNEGDEIGQVVGYIRQIFAGLTVNFPGLKPSEIAVLSRTNAIAGQFREALKADGVPVVEPPKPDLPKDWGLARALIELLAQPDNDTLAFFYHVAKRIKFGATPNAARATIHDARRDATMIGKSLNAVSTSFPKGLGVEHVAPYLDKEEISLEARMIIAEKIKGLPAGSELIDLALEVARIERPEVEPQVEAGVTVTTIHGAKGREWDVVFLVGIEDEIIPGTAKSTDVEEERRILFVGITRARKAVFLSHAASRRASWGNNPIQNHKPSRFLEEIFPS